MTFGKTISNHTHAAVAVFLALLVSFALMSIAQPAVAQSTDVRAPAMVDTGEPAATAVESADMVATETPEAASDYTPLGPEWIKGQPENGAIDFQPQYTDDGQFAYNMHTYILLPVITAISLFVLGLLLWVVVKYRRRANPTPSKTTHNTFIEVVWTLVPVLILVGIAIPSITLLARQYESPPEDAVTIKAIGYQWYWGYAYPDNGGFEVISNMMPEEDAIAQGLPAQLAVDNRMVVPANTPLRIQTTAADVIHSFAVPSLWFKQDAVPGRLNERLLTIKEPGIYYGQCSELCGARHGFMPIAVEALPRAEWEAWVRSKGGTIAGDEPAADAASSDAESDDAETDADGNSNSADEAA
ncbi:MAG: cytochrome c oxidase subunit II [Pontixanthobacter sp.]